MINTENGRSPQSRSAWPVVLRWLLAVGAILLLVDFRILAQDDGAAPESAPADAAGQDPAGDAAAEPGAPLPAVEVGIPDRNLFEIIKAGGILMYPIILCSIITTVFVFERFISLRRGRVIPRPFVKRFLHQLREGQLDRAQALRLCEENDSPVARVFAGALRKWGRPTVEVEQGLIDAGERVATELRRYLRVFNAVSTICPLLGLLGTVFGIIRNFNAIARSQALGRAELLAGGIGEALLATAAGLSVAIPALVFYWYFVSRVDQLVIEIDSLGQDLVNLIAVDGDHELTPPKTVRSRRREPTA